VGLIWNMIQSSVHGREGLKPNVIAVQALHSRNVQGSRPRSDWGMKESPNHHIYIRVLREMGPEKRLGKAFELSEFARALTRRGLEHLHPDLHPSDLDRLYLARMKKARDRAD
jgi:hypothetical protein